MAEDQDAVPTIDGFVEQFVEEFHFAGVGFLFRRALLVQQPQIARGLAQTQERGQHEHLDSACVLLARRFVDLGAGSLQQRGVDFLLRVGQFAIGDVLQLLRQVGGDFLFAAAQEEGPQTLGEPRHRLFVALAGDGQFVAFAEVVAVAQVAGHDEVHERPDVAHGVFHRGAGEDEFAGGAEHPGGLRVLSVRVLDVLGFIQNDVGELEGAVARGVAAQERIAGDDEVGPGDFREMAGALGAFDDDDFALGREFLHFALPVEDERRGADDQ